MDPSLLKQYAQLIKKIRDLEAQLTAAKKQRIGLEEPIMEIFLQVGIQNVTVEGETLYIAKVLYAGTKDDDTLNKLLKKYKLDLLISEKANRNRLSAWVREQQREHKDIPADLLGVLTITEKEALRAVVSGHSKSNSQKNNDIPEMFEAPDAIEEGTDGDHEDVP